VPLLILMPVVQESLDTKLLLKDGVVLLLVVRVVIVPLLLVVPINVI
jgi:hypothetical protein